MPPLNQFRRQVEQLKAELREVQQAKTGRWYDVWTESEYQHYLDTGEWPERDYEVLTGKVYVGWGPEVWDETE